jgi:hypothetical protein
MVSKRRLVLYHASSTAHKWGGRGGRGDTHHQSRNATVFLYAQLCSAERVSGYSLSHVTLSVKVFVTFVTSAQYRRAEKGAAVRRVGTNTVIPSTANVAEGAKNEAPYAAGRGLGEIDRHR